MPSEALARVFGGVQKSPKEPKMAENEKLALSLEVLGTKRLLLEGPEGPGDCIFTVFSPGFSEAKEIGGRAGGW